MGQCSTLPAETRGSSANAGRREGGIFLNNSNNLNGSSDPMREQRHRLNEGGRKESLDFNAIIEDPEQPISTRGSQKYSRKVMKSPNGTVNGPFSPMQAREPEYMKVHEPDQDPMEVEGSRDDAPLSFPPPPEHAVRTRCFKLNLDSEMLGFAGPHQRHQICLGPFSEPPPQLTYSSSEDSSLGANPTAVAIQTAQIFRGITVSRDGTILSQNARATRSNRGNKTKRGEKSRQASKIDKAKDLVEEAMVTGKKPDSDDPANMVSLYIVGEYDDMKQLVRDGSRKLREADGLPDEVLLSNNRPRLISRSKSSTGASGSLTSPRRRASTSNGAGSQRITPSQPTMNTPDKPPTGSGLPQSAPPKLKSHPRDTRSGRKEERTGIRMRLDTCHDFMESRKAGGMEDGGDWSHAWNIWNCGGAGTVSPLQPSSPKEGSNTVVYEGRDAAFGNKREVGVTGRTD